MAQFLASTSYFTPTPPSDIPQETLNHLLSLPPLIQPLSPSLAALHLARVRLLLSIPASPSPGGSSEWWCHQCGGLRVGLGGAKWRKRGVDDTDDGARGRRKKAECSQCGASYQRPKPDPKALGEFPPARTRSKRMAAKSSLVPEVVITTQSITSLESSASASTVPTTDQTSLQKPRPTLLSTPSLTYIPFSAPNPPTYPEPAGRASVSSSTSNGKTTGKRRKNSGLVKLLAENRERAEREAGIGSGSWGLG